VKGMSNVLIVNRSSLEMPFAGQRAITAIRIKKKKQFHKKFLCDTTFSVEVEKFFFFLRNCRWLCVVS
jgi:hypothetical protein